MDQPPLVSCIMVSRGHVKPAKWALESYLRQTYPNKKLYIITTNKDDEMMKYLRTRLNSLVKQGSEVVPRISFIQMVDSTTTVGAQRNQVLKLIKEGYVAIWDDDDVSGPNRLQNAMDALLKANADAYFLERMTVWSERLRSVFITANARWPNTTVARRDALCKWPDRTVGDDIPLFTHLTQNHKCVTGNYPDDFLYVHTGFNVTGDGNFQFLRRGASEELRYAEGIEHIKNIFNIEQYRQWLTEINYKFFK